MRQVPTLKYVRQFQAIRRKMIKRTEKLKIPVDAFRPPIVEIKPHPLNRTIRGKMMKICRDVLSKSILFKFDRDSKIGA